VTSDDQAIPQKNPDHKILFISLGLILLVFAVFGQSARFDFVDYDDSQNVYENPIVKQGLTSSSIRWAFTHAQVCNWVPLTTLSHMADCQIFGLNAGGHHLVNVLLHAASAVLLFLVWNQMTGCVWRSAFIATVFAIHPLRVESVAWVSERKDMLSGLLFILALAAYVRQVRHPWRGGQILVAVLFAAGLLAKSMVATLPFVLLLLDYWPLKRFQDWSQFLHVVREKIPLFVISAADCLATALVPGLMVSTAHKVPILERIGNSLVSYATYLQQTAWPADLAVPYPIPSNGQPLSEVLLSFLLLALITAGAMAWRKSRPFLLIGWLWYLGMLFPVIGIVQISPDFAHADHYTYLPLIGIAVAVAWTIGGLVATRPYLKAVIAPLTIVIIAAMAICCATQTLYWKDDFTLWTRALDCTTNNYVADYNIGNAFVKKGQLDQAIFHFKRSLETRPGNAIVWYNLANSYRKEGKLDEATQAFERALQITPEDADSLNNLANVLVMKGDDNAAVAEYEKLVALHPDYADARYNLGQILFRDGKLDGAIAQFQKYVELDSHSSDGWANLGIAHYQKGENKEAIAAWQKSLELDPGQVAVQNNLAWLLATSADKSLRDGPRAVALAVEADKSTGATNAVILHTLAVSYAEAGNYPMAIQTTEQAWRLATDEKKDSLAATLQKEITAYRGKTSPSNSVGDASRQ
jgi:protein O-mannosyl-transferase